MHMKLVFAMALGAALGAGAVTFGNILSGANAATPKAPDQRLGMAILSATIPFDVAKGTGSGVTWERLGTGVFEIFASRNIDSCVYLASPEFPELFVNTYRQTDTSTVVTIRDKNGAYTNSPFSTMIYCPPVS